MLTLACSDAGYAKTVFDTVDLAGIVAEVCGKIRTLDENCQQPRRDDYGGYAVWRSHPSGIELGDGEARMSVRDSGVGIPARSLPRDPSHANEEGTGLGLAIAKWIVNIHHATKSVESLENQGTAFSVRFRLV